MRRKLFSHGLAMGAAVLTSACLVSDPRPPPGSVTITATSDSALVDGFTTADGWNVSYQHFLASLGHASPEGDDCTFYSDAAYNRVLSMRRSGPQRLSILYALGQCELDFEVSSPWEDSVLGQGVTAADREFMRTPGTDDDVRDAGISLYLEGTARFEGMEKHFAWAFRKRIDYSGCYFSENGRVVHGFTVEQNQNLTRDFTVHGGTVFQDRLGAGSASLSFAAFAAADDEYGNRDGEITLSELGLVPLTDIAADGKYTDADRAWQSLEDYVYKGLFTRIVRYQGDGGCEEVEVFPNDRVLR